VIGEKESAQMGKTAQMGRTKDKELGRKEMRESERRNVSEKGHV
jgi:hypothetical protein